MEVRNRIIGSPMERNYCTSDGRVTQLYIDYLEARARGGAGVLYTEATYVDPRGKGRDLQMGLYADDLIPEFRRLVLAVQKHGARVGPELNFGGRVVEPHISGLQSWAPSAVPYSGAGGAVPRAMSRDWIECTVQCFAEAARRAVEAGSDFVGLHGAHGYLLSQFFSPFCNKREDEYGGSLENRMRFPLEVVAAVRGAIGPDIPLLYRLSGHEHQPAGGITIEDVCVFVPRLEAAGASLVDVSAGMYETNWWITQPMEMPQGVLAPLARAVRAHARVPVSVSGRLTDPSIAEHILESESSDFVTLGRALHADPEFPNKAREGRLDEICTCIACNQGCSDVHARGLPIICLVNTATGREREYAIRPTTAPRRVVIVGGGPAGLEAGRILALRGFNVTIFERNQEVGGQLLLSRHLPGREELAGHLPWLQAAVTRAGAKLALGVEVDARRVLAERPDAIIVATGASPGLPAIPGILEGPVVDPYDVIRRPRGVGRALIIGGGIRGVGIARLLLERGTHVILTEAGKVFAADIATRSRRFQMEPLEASAHVSLHLNTTVELVGDGTATLSNGTTEWKVDAIDLVIPTRPLLPATEVSDALYQRADAPPVFIVGDCSQPRTALEAIHDAAALAHRL
jgi:2,4-dienoyl-CoA reductase-like NADH-dependent reductase (Old Yellow Enzyme family)/thioredoxin reductase